MKLRIPIQYHQAAKEFLGLPITSIESLIAALKKAPPALLIPDLADHVEKEAKIGKKKIRRILDMLASLYTVRAGENMPIKEFVEDFLLAAEKEGFTNKEFPKEKFVGSISDILSLDQSLGVTSKVADVMTQHANVFVGARILTDLRPVFKPDPEQSPSAVVLVHTLKISYHKGNSHEEFFVALDDDDVKELQKVLQRADQKEASLKRLIKKINIPLMNM